MEVRPALCLDLDGTIRFNAESPGGFINSADEIALFDDVEDKLWDYRNAGYLIIGVTNQGGVAFGYKTHEGNQAEFERTTELFDNCPFHMLHAAYHHEKGTVEPYCHRSLYRKPDIGMLAQSESDAFGRGYVIDWDNSLMVGDRDEDEELARRAGVEFVHANSFFARDPGDRPSWM